MSKQALDQIAEGLNGALSIARSPPGSEVELKLFSETTPQNGYISLERWPEGYVLFHHGRIVWTSFTRLGSDNDD